MAVAMKLLMAVLSVLCIFQRHVDAADAPAVHKKGKRPNVHNTTECWYDEQRLDHFTYKPKNERWKQRYLVYKDYWRQKRRNGPIFFYGDLHAY